MPGLVFSDSPSPDPAAPVARWLEEWIESLGHRARNTRLGYISDAAAVATVLLDVVGRSLPVALTDPAVLARWVAQVTGPDPTGSDARLAALIERFALRPGPLLRCQAALESLPLAALAPKGLARAVNRLTAASSPATARRQVAAFGSLLRYLVGQDILASNPLDSPAIQVPRVPTRRSSTLTSEELRRLFATIVTSDERSRAPWPARDFALVVFLCSTGVREGEVIGCLVRDLVQEDEVGYRVAVTGKGSKSRTIPVHAEAAAAVQVYLADRAQRIGPIDPASPLFVRSSGRALDASAVYRLVARSFDRAGVPRRQGSMVHALRHSFATHALDGGATILEVQRLMGHSSLETTRLYLDIVGDGLAAAVNMHVTRRLIADMGDSKP